MVHEAPKTEKDVEKFFLLCMFFIAASFSYGPLLIYPLYQALAASKGEEEVDSMKAGIILMCAKYLSIIVHNLFSKCWKTLRGLQLQVAGCLAFAAVCMAVAASSFVPSVGTLMGVSTLFFTNSNIIASPLWPVPSEERSKIRMLFYYTCCPAGCLWTSFALMCLGRKEFESDWCLRAAVILLPLFVTLMSWLMLPPDGFWGPERMRQKQREREAEIAEEQRQLEEKKKSKQNKQEKQKEQQEKEKLTKVDEDDDFDGFGETSKSEETKERAEKAEGFVDDEDEAKESKESKDGETKPSLGCVVFEAPPIPPEVSPQSPLSGTGSPAPPDVGKMSPLGGLYKQAAHVARTSILAPPLEGLPPLPRLSAAARASHRRTRRNSRLSRKMRQTRQSQRASRTSASSRESGPGRRRSTMEQVKETFKDRQTMITRMSFYTPLNPVLVREVGSISCADRASVFPISEPNLDGIEDEDEPQQSPWRNGRFRVLVGTQCAGLYCVVFWSYSVFPTLINEQGPSLELISFLYSLEGAAQVLCTVLVMPFLDSKLFVKYFSATIVLLFSPPITLCVLGKIHWVFYLLCLLLVDVLLCVTNALLSVVLLRALPWDQIITFYNISCTLAGVLAGTAFVQMPIKAIVGSWELASVIGHGVPFAFLMLLYATHCKTMGELWDVLLQPVRRTEQGDWDPDDLEEDELDELDDEEDPEGQAGQTDKDNPPALLTADKAEKGRDSINPCLE